MNEINIQVVSFARAIGRGYSVLESSCLSLNSSAPMTSRATKTLLTKFLQPAMLLQLHIAKQQMNKKWA